MPFSGVPLGCVLTLAPYNVQAEVMRQGHKSKVVSLGQYFTLPMDQEFSALKPQEVLSVFENMLILGQCH